MPLKASAANADPAPSGVSKVDTTESATPNAETPRAIDCATAASLVRRFLAGEEVVEQRADMRAHLASCGSCQAQYRSSVETVARLARAPRDGGASTRVRGRFFASAAGSRRARRFGLFFVPAAALACVYLMTGRGTGSPSVELKVLEGHVQVGETILDTSSARMELVASQGGRTEPGARARIEAGATNVEIDPSTAFATERLHPLRIRLFEGRVTVQGTLAVTTHVGVLEITEGRVHVTLDERGLTLENVAGKLVYADRMGLQDVAEGELLWVPVAPAGRH